MLLIVLRRRRAIVIVKDRRRRQREAEGALVGGADDNHRSRAWRVAIKVGDRLAAVIGKLVARKLRKRTIVDRNCRRRWRVNGRHVGTATKVKAAQRKVGRRHHKHRQRVDAVGALQRRALAANLGRQRQVDAHNDASHKVHKTTRERDRIAVARRRDGESDAATRRRFRRTIARIDARHRVDIKFSCQTSMKEEDEEEQGERHRSSLLLV